MSEDNHPILFMQLVMQNQQIAMMAMGKIKNPVTDKIDRNLLESLSPGHLKPIQTLPDKRFYKPVKTQLT